MTSCDYECFSVIVFLSSPIQKKTKTIPQKTREDWQLFLLVTYLTGTKLTLCVAFL